MMSRLLIPEIQWSRIALQRSVSHSAHDRLLQGDHPVAVIEIQMETNEDETVHNV